MSNSKRLKNKESITNCSTCGRSVIGERHVRCLRCPHFIQCIQCLSSASECDGHLFSHNFFVVEPRPGHIYTEDWDIADEALLLFGVKIFGLGNWNDISNFMKSKSAVDCEAHYRGVYFNSPTAPMPIREVLQPMPIPPPPAFDTQPVESCPSVAHEKHMNEKNKKEKTTPAEYSGYMPYRHEFEVDWNNDAEMLVAKIEFNQEEDNYQTFQTKIMQLLSYNSQLAERRFRTKVIEEWDIQNKEVKPVPRGEKDDLRILGGISEAERDIDSRIIPLAPYYGYDKMQKLSTNLHKRLRYIELIKKYEQWQKNGVRSHTEGNFFISLLRCIKDGKIPHSEFDKWNEIVSDFNKTNGKLTVKNDEYLSIPESHLCTTEDIHPQLYLALKCLLMREVVWRKKIRKDTAVRMAPQYAEEMAKIYDLLQSLGMI